MNGQLGSNGVLPTHVSGETIEREPHTVLLTNDLHQYLGNCYKNDYIASSEIDGIIRELRQHPASDLYLSNKEIITLVSNDFEPKREDRLLIDLYIRLIDCSLFHQEPRQTDPAPLRDLQDWYRYYGGRR